MISTIFKRIANQTRVSYQIKCLMASLSLKEIFKVYIFDIKSKKN
ncbi:hypothetical protein PRO82_001835 [Candidatus Protochlamydia amoebophila]|nr:hypothetical protein [Candidatus Protochlamydia amoebophila]